MTHPRLTRRRLLHATAGVALTGLAGCIGSSGGAVGDGESSPTGSQEDPAGHAEEAHRHDTVSEPRDSREVLVNTARDAGTDAFHFNPHVTWVTVGGTVTWKLESGTHTATAYHPGNDQPRLVPEGTDAWDSGTLSEEGETYTHTFEKEGVYHYLCKPHEQFGMLATVIVGTPHADEEHAIGEIPENKPEEVHGKLNSLNEMVRSILNGGHHDEETESGHHDEETESGHHDEGTETDHHDEETESGHHDEETETGHHDEETESGHHDEETETDHHDE